LGGGLDKEEGKMKDDLDEIPLTYVLYIVLGFLGIVAGIGFVAFRMFRL